MESPKFSITFASIYCVYSLFYEWTTNKESRPANGSLLQLITKDEETDVIAA